VFLLARTRSLQGDARANLRRLADRGMKAVEIAGPAGMATLRKELRRSALIIDAIFGTGFHGKPDPFSASVIRTVNGSGLPVLAVDIPSGVDGRTGAAPGAAVRAAATVTMGLMKSGLLFHPGRALAGSVNIADIGFPPGAVNGQKIDLETADADYARSLLPHRAPDAHKGSCGTVLVLAGSAGYTGAATLASMAALRGGAGLVCLGIPESLHDIMEAKLTEVITRPLPETPARSLSPDGLDAIEALLARADALALGPGLSTHPGTADLVAGVLQRLTVPAVIDADGLNILATRPAAIRPLRSPAVLTPHVGEMARLLKTTNAAVKDDPVAAVREAAARFKAVIVLKGAPTVTARPDGRVWINTTGNPGMATAGAGDVLTGLIAALLAQGLKAAEAAVLGVYLHGLAGDCAVGEKTEYGLIAGDLVDHLPRAFRELMEAL
jgi:NAD(P)H-hydrate epimerase